MHYRSRQDPQHAVRVRLRELAASQVRFGYRRLVVMLRGENGPGLLPGAHQFISRVV